VAPDRVISTVDPEARHGHKTQSRNFDGYKGHVAIDPDSEIITATEVTATTPFTQTQAVGANRLSVAVYPREQGPVNISIQYTNGQTNLLNPFQIYAQLSLPARHLGPLPVTLKQMAPGTWIATGAELPLAGRWQLLVGVLTSPISETDRTYTFTASAPPGG